MNLINKLYGVKRDSKEEGDEDRKATRMGRSVPLLTQLKSWVAKTGPQVMAQNALGKAIGYLTSNWSKLERCVERNRSMNPTYHKVEAKVTVESVANSSMAAALRSLLQTTHGAVAQVRGAATYRALGR